MNQLGILNILGIIALNILIILFIKDFVKHKKQGKNPKWASPILFIFFAPTSIFILVACAAFIFAEIIMIINFVLKMIKT